MKRHVIKLVLFIGILALAMPANAVLIPITPSTGPPLTGLENDQPSIDLAIAGSLGGSVELYKQDVGGAESGPLASSYETTFFNTPTDPSGALIEYMGGPIVGPTAYLLVKDGKHDPGWYLFNLTAEPIFWHGTEDLELSGFWPDQGAISHVTLYGNATSVPEAGALLLFGSGLIGLVGYRRVRRMQ